MCTTSTLQEKYETKIPQQPISTVIVDVHVYKIFGITDFIAALQFVKRLSAVHKSERKWSHCAHHITKML